DNEIAPEEENDSESENGGDPEDEDGSENESGTDPENEENLENDNNEELPYHIVTSNEVWSNNTINNDVFVGPEAVLSISGNVTINGNIYLYGALRSFGGLTLNGTLYAQQVNFG